MKRLPAILICFLLTACDQSASRKKSKETIPYTSERIVEISHLIDKQKLLHLNPKSSQCIEEQIGDGYLGPSDFFIFCVLSVAPKDITSLRHTLSPLQTDGTSTHYATPRKKVDWWLSEAEFKKLELFKPELLLYRQNGWTGISASTGKIYFFGFTQ